jgi:hypothetical protein
MRRPEVGIKEVQRWLNRYSDLAQRNLGALRQAQEDARNRDYSPAALVSDMLYFALNFAEAAFVPFESVQPALDLRVRVTIDEVVGVVDLPMPPVGNPTANALNPGGFIPAANIHLAYAVGGPLAVRIDGLNALVGLAPGTFTGLITDGPAAAPLSAWCVPITLVVIP